MYERFTDCARKVMQLANQEAQRFNHEYIGTEHILLGLIKEGSGVASHVFRGLSVDLEKVRDEVGKLVQPGPDRVTLGKLPQNSRAQKAIVNAIAEAKRLDHNYVGTEHLLLGLLCDSEGIAAVVLKNLDLTADQVREEAMAILGYGGETPSKDDPKSETDIIAIVVSRIGREEALRRLLLMPPTAHSATTLSTYWVMIRDQPSI